PLTRIVIDERLQLPTDSRLAQSAKETPVIVFTLSDYTKKTEELTRSGVAVIRTVAKGQKIDLQAALAELAKREITSVIVEGGSETNGRFVSERLVDKYTFFIAPKVIGGREAPGPIGGEGIAVLDEALLFESFNFRVVGQDIEITAYPLREKKLEE